MNNHFFDHQIGLLFYIMARARGYLEDYEEFYRYQYIMLHGKFLLSFNLDNYFDLTKFYVNYILQNMYGTKH